MEDSPFDLELMLKLSDDMATAQTTLLKLKHADTLLKAYIAQTVTSDSKYWVNDKPPTMAYISSHYHVLGHDEETRDALNKMAEQIIELEGDLLRLRTKFQIEKDKLEVWRTVSANNRGARSFIGI